MRLDSRSRGEFASSEQALPDAKPGTDRFLFWSAILVILLTRLPFLGAGYGNDADAWALADTARHISATGEYAASRLPGYPLQELLCSLLWKGGPFALNGCTAVLSAIAVICFMRSVKLLGSSDHWLAGLALALTPVVFVNSTNSMDYVWALAFILASHHCALTGRATVTGCLLGVAVGCRITSALMLVPLGFVLLCTCGKRRRWASGGAFCAATCLIAAAAYLPVVERYGWGFLSFSETPDYPPLLAVISRVSLRIWGSIGLLAILGGVFFTLVRRRAGQPRTSIPASAGTVPFIAAAVAIGLYVLAYLRLPLEEGYLIPAVPFVILLLGRMLPRPAFRLVCIALCFSPFLCSFGRAASASAHTYSARALRFRLVGRELVLDVLRGPILRDYAERVHGMAFVDRVLAHGRTLPEGSVVAVGYWLPQIRVKLGLHPPEGTRYVYLLHRDQLREYQADGSAVYFLPEMAEFNRQVHGLDLLQAGATPLDIYWRN